MFYEFTTVKGEKFTLNMNCIEYFTETKKGTLIVCKSGMDYEVLHTYSLFWHNNVMYLLFDKKK